MQSSPGSRTPSPAQKLLQNVAPLLHPSQHFSLFLVSSPCLQNVLSMHLYKPLEVIVSLSAFLLSFERPGISFAHVQILLSAHKISSFFSHENFLPLFFAQSKTG